MVDSAAPKPATATTSPARVQRTPKISAPHNLAALSSVATHARPVERTSAGSGPLAIPVARTPARVLHVAIAGALALDEPARREAWLRDQYQHPEEHSHTIAEVQGWFAENGVEYLRTYLSAVLDDEPEELFAHAPDNWRPEGWLAQVGWIWTLGHEGGFFTGGRRTGLGSDNVP